MITSFVFMITQIFVLLSRTKEFVILVVIFKVCYACCPWVFLSLLYCGDNDHKLGLFVDFIYAKTMINETELLV